MYLRGTDTFIGMVNIHAISWASARGEFGYWMDSKYTGQGLMTEAVVALETYFFKMGFNRLAILANPKNKASVAIARRLGYVKEGTERARNYNQYMKEYEDLTIFSKLRSEWKK
jgi:ribosomal-protein-serine acetyltransferase